MAELDVNTAPLPQQASSSTRHAVASDANSSALPPLPESRTRNKRGHRYGDERGSHRLQETAWTGICACWSSASVNAILQIPTGAGKRPPGLLPGIMGGTR